MWWLALLQPAFAGDAYDPSITQHGDHLIAVVDPVEDAEWVSVRVHFTEGWDTETRDTSGVTHLMEHLWFRSTTSTGAEFMTQAKALGCSTNGYTSPTDMVLHWECPKAVAGFAVEEALRAVEDGMRGLTPGHAEVERRIIDQELRERYTGVRSMMQEIYERAVPGMQGPLERLREDPEASPWLDLPTSVARYEHLLQRPHVLAISGAFDADDVKARLLSAHGPGVEPTLSAPQAPVQVALPEHAPISLKPVPAPVWGPTLMVSYPLPVDVARLDVADAVAGKVSRLMRRLMIWQPVQYELDVSQYSPGYVQCAVTPDVQVPMLNCEIGLQRADHADIVLRTTLLEVQKHFDGFGVEEWARELKFGREITHEIFDVLMASPTVRTRHATESLAKGELPPDAEALAEQGRKARDRMELRAMAEPLAATAASAVVFVPGPMPRVAELPETRVMPPEPTAQVPPLPERADFALEVQERRLANGMRLVAVRSGEEEQEQVVGTLRFHGGPVAVTDMLGREVSGRILRSAEPAGDGALHVGRANHGGLMFTMRTGQKHLKPNLKELALWVARPELEPKDTARVKQTGRQRRHNLAYQEQARLANPEQRLEDIVRHKLMPGYLPAEPQTLARWDKERRIPESQMDLWVQKVLRPSNATLVLAVPGEGSLEDALAVAEKAFGKWKPQVEAVYWHEDRPAPAPTDLTPVWIEPMDASDHLLWACRPENDASSIGTGALQRLLSTHLFQTIRARHGLVYSPQTSSERWEDGTRVVSVAFKTAPGQGELLEQTLQDMLDAFEVTPEMARQERGRTLRMIEGTRTNSMSLASRVHGLLDVYGAADVDAWIARAEAVTEPEALQAAFESCRARQTWAVSGTKGGE